MHKLSLFSIFIFLGVFAIAQPAGKWSTGGNAISTGDFIGTTNNFPLDFRTNNNQVMSLDANGNLSLKNLIGSGHRILITDANGNISYLPQGSSGQFLLSNGTWANLPAGSTSFNVIGNNLFNTNSGNFGIGTSSPSYKLDVFGDARISNNLYVGGGVVITNKVDASIEVKAGDMIVNNNLSVAGSSKFSGSLTATQGLFLDNSNSLSISYSSPTGTNAIGDFLFAKSGVLRPASACSNPTQDPWFYFGGRIQLFDVASNVALTMGSDGVGSSIDASGNGGLLVNYYCGKDIHLCKGVGGKVSVGNNFEAGFAVTDLNVTANLNAAGGTKIALQTNSQHSSDGGWNTKIITNRDGTKALGIIKGQTGAELFTVYGDGRTAIGDNYIPAGGYMLSVKGKVICEELWVKNRLDWPDYVFSPEYKLLSLKELKSYVEKNKHLPNIPSAQEVNKNAAFSTGELQIKMLEKIEELTLYIIELEKEINSIKSKQIEHEK